VMFCLVLLFELVCLLHYGFFKFVNDTGQIYFVGICPLTNKEA